VDMQLMRSNSHSPREHFNSMPICNPPGSSGSPNRLHTVGTVVLTVILTSALLVSVNALGHTIHTLQIHRYACGKPIAQLCTSRLRSGWSMILAIRCGRRAIRG
jgi:hypothetical protein